MNIVINVMTYGDFDMPYIVATMVGPDTPGIKSILTDIQNNNCDTADATQAIEQLKDLGFSLLKDHELTIGGHL